MAVKTENFSFVRGDTFSQNVTICNCLEDITEIYFTVKETYEDKNPVIQKTLTTGGITFLDKTDEETKYNILINATDTDLMKVNTEYLYDLELVSGTIKKTILKGTITLEADVTRTINEVK